MKYFLSFICLFAAVSSFAQAPVINDISTLKTGPSQKIVITGSGFNATAGNNIGWFDHVKGTVTAATIYSLEVQVPLQARFSNVEVTNLGNNLSTKSKLKFLPSYGGVSLPDVTKFTAATPVAAPYLDGNELFDVVSCDLDLDGKPDLVTSRGGPTSPATITDLFIYQNTSSAIGSISFARFDKTNLAALNVGSPTANVACGDLNGDGKPDIVASRGGTSTRNEVFILKNTTIPPGTMAFSSQAKLLLDVGEFAFRISIRDLNGDGKPEIVVSNAHDDLIATTDNVIYVFPNQSTLSTVSFGAPVKLTVTGADSTYGLDVQDIDGDSKPDIIVNQFQKQDVFIFRNSSSGNISFDPVKKLAAAGNFIQITSSDLNNDGLLDLIATQIGNVDSNIQFWINNSTPGNISFNTAQVLTTTPGSWGVDVGDIDGDGDADMVVANKDGNSLNNFRQGGPFNFIRLDIPTPNYFAQNLRIGDMESDGKPDIAYSAFPNSGLKYTINVLRNSNCWNPVITGSSTTICNGQTIPLQTTPAFGVTYSWSPQASATNTLGATAAGTYTVTLTGTIDTGCTNVSAGYILTQDVNTFPSDPAIGNTPSLPCLNTALNLSTATVATATYQWNGPNNFSSTSQNPTISSVTQQNAGVYNLQVTLANGCQSNIISKQLDVASVPVLPVTASPSATGCTGGNITLSVSGSGYKFQWYKGGSTIGGVISTTPATLSLTSLS